MGFATQATAFFIAFKTFFFFNFHYISLICLFYFFCYLVAAEKENIGFINLLKALK